MHFDPSYNLNALVVPGVISTLVLLIGPELSSLETSHLTPFLHGHGNLSCTSRLEEACPEMGVAPCALVLVLSRLRICGTVRGCESIADRGIVLRWLSYSHLSSWGALCVFYSRRVSTGTGICIVLVMGAVTAYLPAPGSFPRPPGTSALRIPCFVEYGILTCSVCSGPIFGILMEMLGYNGN